MKKAIAVLLAGATLASASVAAAQPYGRYDGGRYDGQYGDRYSRDGDRYGRDSDRDGRPDRREWNRDRDRDGRPDQYDRYDRRRDGYQRQMNRQFRYYGNQYGYSGYEGRWRTGQRYPYYNNRRYVIDDYRYYGLPAPRPGYRYYRDDNGDVIMAAIASGVIGLIIGGVLSNNY